MSDPFAYLSNIRVPEETDKYLTVLAQIADVLELEDPTYSSISAAISCQSSEELSLRQMILRHQRAEDELSEHLATMRFEESLINKWDDSMRDSAMSKENIVALERRKATLTAKAKEYQKELEETISKMPESPVMTISELCAFKDKLRQKEHELKLKRAKIQSFQGLPPNLELARHELQKARDEQMKLIQLRERLLGKMASGVS